MFQIKPSDVIAIGISEFERIFSVAKDVLSKEVDREVDQAIICAGNKLHTLALCFVKLALPQVHFFIRVPRGYRENNTPGTGHFQLVQVTNTFAPIR